MQKEVIKRLILNAYTGLSDHQNPTLSHGILFPTGSWEERNPIKEEERWQRKRKHRRNYPEESSSREQPLVLRQWLAQGR